MLQKFALDVQIERGGGTLSGSDIAEVYVSSIVTGLQKMMDECNCTLFATLNDAFSAYSTIADVDVTGEYPPRARPHAAFPALCDPGHSLNAHDGIKDDQGRIPLFNVDGASDMIVSKHTHVVNRVGKHGGAPSKAHAKRVQVFGLWYRRQLLLVVPSRWDVWPYRLDDAAIQNDDPVSKLCRLLLALATFDDAWHTMLGG